VPGKSRSSPRDASDFAEKYDAVGDGFGLGEVVGDDDGRESEVGDEAVLLASLRDNVKARRVLPDGSSERIVRSKDAPPRRSQQLLLEQTSRQPDSIEGNDAAGKKRKKGKR
jgi:hypothetical protein